jgi:hypothetical protein
MSRMAAVRARPSFASVERSITLAVETYAAARSVTNVRIAVKLVTTHLVVTFAGWMVCSLAAVAIRGSVSQAQRSLIRTASGTTAAQALLVRRVDTSAIRVTPGLTARRISRQSVVPGVTSTVARACLCIAERP